MHSDQFARADGGDPSLFLREYAVIKRSVLVAGHKTSVSLEDAFWIGLKDIASRRRMALSMLIDTIDRNRKTNNLSSAIRIFVLEHFRDRAITTMLIGERQIAPSHFAPLAPE